MRAVLTYHSIDGSGSPISVSPDAFERHLAWFTSGRVVVESLAALARAGDPDTDGAHRVAITFDDGFTSFASFAWPRLHAAGLPATVFLVSRHLGATNLWGGRRVSGIPELSVMSWDDAGRCAEEGAEIGAHSRTHPHLPLVPPAAALEEMAGGRQDLGDRLGVRVSAFAYPYGDVSPAVADTARSIFDIACTTEYRALSGAEPRHLLPRLDMFYFQAPDALRDWGGAAFRRRIAVRRTLRAVRRRLDAVPVRGWPAGGEGLMMSAVPQMSGRSASASHGP